ncbi:Myelin-associated glycoprotein [Bagarius yarrelli]|uniref:Myelin-associated glycoprotein n=1 Tax=Bagarius yarrelli TaxID=175774 RepID=A0A556U5Y6_BAGYA|nr:Myelin-associated glycoprotein [Bagarius yarrelli]
MVSFKCLLCIYALWLKVSPAESESWNAEVPQSVVGLEGSCVVIPCLFRYPGADKQASHLTGIWYTESSETVYHSSTSKISSMFQQRTSLWGDLSHRNCSLKINPLRHSDGGPFTFRIEIEDFNKFTFVHSKVSITIKDSPGQSTLLIPKDISAGKRVTATCSVFHSCPSDPPNLTWSHKGTVSSQSLQQTNGQWKITSSLTFTPSKADHKKSLTCTAVFPGGKESIGLTTLYIKYAPENVAVISELSVAEGSNMNMTCSSDSNPAPHTYHWFTEAGTLLSDEHTFTLKNVSRHMGIIYCTAINTVGQTNSSPTQLNVLYPPEIKAGSSCTLDTSGVTCLFIVDSHPTSEIKLWAADPSSELRRTHEEKHGTLTIVTLQGALGFSDIVHCQAINSQGNYTMTIQVLQNHEKHNTQLLYISAAAIAFLVMIIGLSVWKIHRWKCKDLNPIYDGSQHVYGNMTTEGPYEEEYPYEHAGEYEATGLNTVSSARHGSPLEGKITFGSVWKENRDRDISQTGKSMKSDSQISRVSRVAPMTSPTSASRRVNLPGVMDAEGRVDESRLRMYIIKNGGVSPAERGLVWRFLFGMYPCSSTTLERTLLLEELTVRYHVMKKKWQCLLPGAVHPRLNGTDAELVAAVQYFKQRQDREREIQQYLYKSKEVMERISFLELQAQNQDHVSLTKMSRGRIEPWPTTQVSYAQGMNDLCSRFLEVLDSEVDTYWSFCCYMEKFSRDFCADGLHRKIELEAALLKELDPHLYAHLVIDNMERLTFCHRWLLLGFQREFEHSDALRLFEILSCDHLQLISQQVDRALYQERLNFKHSFRKSSQVLNEPQSINQEFTFELFICATILLENRDSLLSCRNEVQLLQFTNSVFKLPPEFDCFLSVSSLQGTLDLNSSLKKAEELFYNYCKRSSRECLSERYQRNKSKEEPFLFLLRSLFS